jgi:hypothetical protein
MFERTKARAHSISDMAMEITGALIVIAIGIGSIAAPIFFATNTSALAGWDATSRTIWPYLFLLSIVAILFGILYMAKKSHAS